MAFISLPAGTVISYAGSTAPSGWLLCDGTSYSQTLYPELYIAVGGTYNTQTNPTTNVAWTTPGVGNFRVPDYRGAFVRAVGSPYAGDPVTLGGFQTHKTAKNGITLTNNAVSSAGVSSNHSHSDSGHNHNQWYQNFASGGPIAAPAGGWSVGAGGGSSGGTNVYTANGAAVIGNQSSDHAHSVTSSVTATGDNESRPHNVGVNYIIKCSNY